MTQHQNSKSDSSNSDSTVSEFILNKSEIDAVVKSELKLKFDKSNVDFYTNTEIIFRSKFTENKINNNDITENSDSI